MITVDEHDEECPSLTGGRDPNGNEWGAGDLPCTCPTVIVPVDTTGDPFSTRRVRRDDECVGFCNGKIAFIVTRADVRLPACRLHVGDVAGNLAKREEMT